MEYINTFNTTAEYNAAKSGETYGHPHVSLVLDNNEIHYEKHDYADDYLTFVAKESGTFTFAPNNSNVISYSTDDGKTWTEGNSVTANNGTKVMWKGTMTPASSQGIGTFGSTGNFDVQGNVMSLLFGDNYRGQTSLTGKDTAFRELFSNNTKIISAENLSLPATTLTFQCYSNMFNECASLTTAPELPATTLANQCYQSMFYGCTSLTTAPVLPATTLANSCYDGMFHKCTSLTTAPALPATTLTTRCYYCMFQGCTSLAIAPELPAETLANNCYYCMFQGCTSLTTAPALPATTLVNDCYIQMFQGCTSLTAVPELPAETLANYCYYQMFQGCTSLASAPVLPATTLAFQCYSYMFESCTSLNYIKAMFTTTPSTKYTDSWVSGVSATGIFVKNSAAEWDVSGANGIPTGWTVQRETP